MSAKEGKMVEPEYEEYMLRVVTHYGCTDFSGLLGLAKKEADARKERGWHHAYDLQTIKSG